MDDGGTMVTGKVVQRFYAKGSKSERMAIFLETDDGELMLRRRGGNAFHDPELVGLVGETIECMGVVPTGSKLLLVKQYRVV
jgi:hypothetical protein